MDAESEKTRIALTQGWFTMDREKPQLIGNRCKSCGDFFFPRTLYCRNPQCMGRDLEEIPLARTGKLWSFTVNHYEPPPPFVAPDPFVPYALGVVELQKERLMVMGQISSGCDFEKLKIGMDMELVVEKLYDDEKGNEVVIWKWKPVQTPNI